MKKLLSVIIAITLITSCIPWITVSATSWFSDGFEDESSLEKWESINGGSVEISTQRHKIDKSSLKWTYQTGSVLKLSDCDSFSNFVSHRGTHGIKLWIYSDNKTDAEMTIRIGTSDRIDIAPSYKFTVNMNFEGWRCIWAHVNTIAATGNSNAGADTMLIAMPEEMGSGVLYLDAFDVTDSVLYTACADFQLPYIPLTYTGYQYETYKRIPESFKENSCTVEDVNAFKTIQDRLENYIFPKDIVDYTLLDSEEAVKVRYDALQKEIKEAIEIYDGYNIKRRKDGSMDGPGLTAVHDSIGVSVMKFEKIWVALALDWKLNKNEESLQKIMDLFDWSYEQGWAEGSAMGAMKFTEIRLVGYVYAVYLMRDELQQTGRFERELANLRWRSEFGNVFAYNDPDISEVSSVDVDKMRSVVLFQLIYILSMEDSPLKVNYMKAYVKYLENIIMPRPGAEGGIKKDYTFWHHYSTFMSEYGAEAINVICQIKYLINDTCFDINSDATDTLSKVLDTYRISSNKFDLPLRVRGRFPYSNNTMITIAPAYAFMAASGDDNAAEVFLDIWDKSSSNVKSSYKNVMPSITWITTLGQLVLFDQVISQVTEKGLIAATPKQGTYIYPYGGYAIHRRDNWMAAVGGFSKYIWDYEGSGTENFYGRYMNYGTITIVPESGFVGGGINSEKGWDWSRWPGSTTKHLSCSELELKNVGRNYSDETFLGGISSGENGIYAMKLHDTMYDNTFSANKSWFFFGDKIICLGSDIKNSDTEHTTETTLFQNVMTSTASPIYVNSVEITEFPFSEAIEDESVVCVTDTVGNSYIIPDTNALMVERTVQNSYTNKGKVSTGNVSSAYINHGKNPKSGEYEYVILPNTDNGTALRKINSMGYEVLLKDNTAHIIRNTDDGMIGYVVFDNTAEFDFGTVKSASLPCVIMETQKSYNELSISFCDPDLRVVTSGTVSDLLTESELRKVQVVLEGAWELKGACYGVSVISKSRNSTIVEFDGKDGKQTDAEFVRVVRDGSICLCDDSEIYLNEAFSEATPPNENQKGKWLYGLGTPVINNGTLSMSDSTYSLYTFKSGAIKYNPEKTAENQYLLKFDFTRTTKTIGLLYPLRIYYGGELIKDIYTAVSGNTFSVGVSNATPNGQSKTILSGIDIGEWCTFEILYKFGETAITCDITVYDDSGNVGTLKDYAMNTSKNNSSTGISGFGFCCTATGVEVKFDNMECYKYKKAPAMAEVAVSNVKFGNTVEDKEVIGEVNLSNVKKGTNVYCSADFEIKPGYLTNNPPIGIFAVYQNQPENKTKLVNTVLFELNTLTESYIPSLSTPLFTAKEDGNYTVKLFLWSDAENMIPLTEASNFN